MAWTRDRISEATGFDWGDLFTSEEQVREYFTRENIAAMFGECALTDEELAEMAEAVIANRWHMAPLTWQVVAPIVIKSEGDRHSVTLRIGPDRVEVLGGFTPEIGPEDEVEPVLTQAGEALQEIVEAIEQAGLLSAVRYTDGDTVCWAHVTLTDGRRICIGVHTDSGASVTVTEED